MKKLSKRFSIAELILFFIVWAAFTGLFLRIIIPQVQGKLPINGGLLVAEVVLLSFSTAIVYEVFKKKKVKDKPPKNNGLSI